MPVPDSRLVEKRIQTVLHVALTALETDGDQAAAVSDSDDGWTRRAGHMVGWMMRGGYRGTMREDLLRDVVTLWEDVPPDDPAWDAAAAALATCLSMSSMSPPYEDAACAEAIRAYSALLDAIQAHVAHVGADVDHTRAALDDLLAA